MVYLYCTRTLKFVKRKLKQYSKAFSILRMILNLNFEIENTNTYKRVKFGFFFQSLVVCKDFTF